SPLRINSWLSFNVTTPLQFVPRLTRAQMLIVTPAAVRTRPSHHAAGVSGTSLRLSPFQFFSNNSQNPKISGMRCCTRSSEVSRFFTLFVLNHMTTHTPQSAIHMYSAHADTRPASIANQFMLGLSPCSTISQTISNRIPKPPVSANLVV